MNFSLEGKVALVTGGTGGIGLSVVKEFLKKGAKGITLVDINQQAGDAAISDIEKEFGQGRAIFLKADVTSATEFETAIQKTIETFKNFDILVNNAGIFNEYNYERVINVNLLGSIHGTYLALEKYIQKHRSGTEGVIVNLSSIAGVEPMGGIPTYVATKFGVHGLSLAFGSHYERTKVKVLAVCPGMTDTKILDNMIANNNYLGRLEPYRKAFEDSLVGKGQTTEFCAKKIVQVIEKAKTATVWVIDSDEPYQFVLPDRQTMKKIYL